MKNYKECSDEEYERALSQKNTKNLKEITDEDLYILYTKFMHDYCTIDSSWSSYTLDLSIKYKQRIDLYEKELKRRGIYKRNTA